MFASPIFWLTGGNALAAYNLSFFLSWPLSAFTAYLLAFVLTRRHDAAFLAGLSYGFTPYRTAELGHLQMLSSFWIPLCLVALHRFLETRRGGWLVLFAAAWVLQALANGYFIFFGAVLVGLWVLYFCSTQETWRTVPAIAATCVLANVPLVPVLLEVPHGASGVRPAAHDVRGPVVQLAGQRVVRGVVVRLALVQGASGFEGRPVPRRHGPDPGARRGVAQPVVEARGARAIPIVQVGDDRSHARDRRERGEHPDDARDRAVAAGMAGDNGTHERS